MQNIIGKVRLDAQTKITNGNFDYDNYSQNPEYIEMLKVGNFIDVTEEQFQFIRSNNDNGTDVCVINGKLQVYVTPDSIKLEKAKAMKLCELQSFYSSNKTWECTLKDIDGALTQNSDWLLAKISTTPIFYDDKGNVIKKIFTVDKVFEIIDKINAKGFEILTIKKTITTKINSAKKVTDIENIDIESEFAKINKIINI